LIILTQSLQLSQEQFLITNWLLVQLLARDELPDLVSGRSLDFSEAEDSVGYHDDSLEFGLVFRFGHFRYFL
jgi:hypothetical protein